MNHVYVKKQDEFVYYMYLIGKKAKLSRDVQNAVNLKNKILVIHDVHCTFWESSDLGSTGAINDMPTRKTDTPKKWNTFLYKYLITFVAFNE